MNKIALIAAIVFSSLATANAHACVMPPMIPTEYDMLHPPENDLLAFQGKVLKVIPHGPMNSLPHSGYDMEFEVVKMFQGDVATKSIVVYYDICSGGGTKVGSTEYVLARKIKDGRWVAQSTWSRASP